MTHDVSMPIAPSGAAQPTSTPPAWSPPRPIVESIPERIAAPALLAALVGGLLAQLLFFGQFLGLNVPLWIAFVLGAAFVLRRPDAHLDRLDLWLPPAALAFAAFVALRDDSMLVLFDLASTGALTLASVVAIGGQPVSRGAWSTIIRLAATASFVYLAGAPHLAAGLRPIVAAFPRRGDSLAWRLVRGLLLALPLLLVFIALFAAADAVFDAYVRGFFALDINSAELAGRAVLGLLAAWLLAGTIACAWLTREQGVADASVPTASRARLGSVEATVVLFALNSIFGLFVILQGAYLFGGADTLAVSGMTYSDYARRGFFELIAVALLAGVLLVALANLVAERGRWHRLLAGLLAGLTAVILVSALYRLALYQQAYGWTELRFYALAAICWLGLGVVITVIAVALDRISAVPKLALGAGLLVALACNAIGPQSFVTQQNVERLLHPEQIAAGGESGLDVGYLRRLGSDAVRVLVLTVDRLPEPQHTEVTRLLAAQNPRLTGATDAGWPSWNLARQSALEALTAAGY